jgi:uncharacterized membrane protein (DUF485 family)
MAMSEKPDIHSEKFLHSLMRRQLRLSISCATAFVTVLLGLPLANYFFPEFMAQRVFGFTLSWLLLGIGFCPVVWLISSYFIRKSIALEEAEVREVAENSEDVEGGKRREGESETKLTT